MEHDINKMELFKTTVFSLMLAILAELYVVIIENTNSLSNAGKLLIHGKLNQGIKSVRSYINIVTLLL